MPCDSEVQRIVEVYHFTKFLQAVIDAVKNAVVLLPLLARGFCRNDRKEEGSTFLPVTVGYFLKRRFPRNGDFPAGDVLAVCELSVPDVTPRQAEDVIAPHATGIDREQEDVAGEDSHLRFAAEVQVA